MGTLPGFDHQVTEMAGLTRDRVRTAMREASLDQSSGGLRFRGFRTVSAPWARIEAAVKTLTHFCDARSETETW
jgi:hypothetical protein